MRSLFIVLLILAHAYVLAACGTFNISAPVTTPAQPADAGSSDGSASAPAAPILAASGVRTETPQPVTLSWVDPSDGETWTVVALNVPFKEAVCPKPSALPETTIPTKFADFILSHAGVLSNGGSYWTSIQGTIGRITRTIESDGEMIRDSDETSTHVVVCEERK